MGLLYIFVIYVCDDKARKVQIWRHFSNGRKVQKGGGGVLEEGSWNWITCYLELSENTARNVHKHIITYKGILTLPSLIWFLFSPFLFLKTRRMQDRWILSLRTVLFLLRNIFFFNLISDKWTLYFRRFCLP